jgi:hypothetical protein
MYDRSHMKDIDEEIRRRTRDRISRYAGEPDRVVWRHLKKLDREVDVERATMAEAAALVLASLFLGSYVHRGFLAIAALTAGLLTQHALTGSCGPSKALKRMGFRGRDEIDHEKHSLETAMRSRMQAEKEAKGAESGITYGFEKKV